MSPALDAEIARCVAVSLGFRAGGLSFSPEPPTRFVTDLSTRKGVAGPRRLAENLRHEISQPTVSDTGTGSEVFNCGTAVLSACLPRLIAASNGVSCL